MTLRSMEKFEGTPFCKLPWESRFVGQLPGDAERANFVRQVPGNCYSEVSPTAVRAPYLIGWASKLGQELGISCPGERDLESLELLAGNKVLPNLKPYAARYGGHQFGNWAGQLGDGRAITLGEAVRPPVGRLEFQLKGAGPTPYSRRADGRAVLRSSVREFLCSEAMHFLGVPTTRALSLVGTGEAVVRDLFYDGNPRPEPGAIVCRVAPSFLRFGSFEILASQQDPALLKKLADYLIQEHYPALDTGDPDVYGLLLEEIARRTARMVAHWMRVGFVHGVMNTDNMSALGLTLDYGPYGWLEPYDPTWTPNTTDAEGRRYRFGNQPTIALWNLARLGEAFLTLIPDEERVLRSLTLYREFFTETSGQMLARKLGVEALQAVGDAELVDDLFKLMQEAETDFTIFFRKLSDFKVDAPAAGQARCEFFEQVTPAFYAPNAIDSDLRARWSAWSMRYVARLRRDDLSDLQRSSIMKQANPKYVLRNYLAQNAITAAEAGDLSVLERLQRVLETPYAELPDEEVLAEKRPEWARHAPGCSALSCSS